jgi:hypothetical protein
MFTQYVPWLSESLYGIPLMVTFTRVASLRTRIPVAYTISGIRSSHNWQIIHQNGDILS